MIHRGDGRLPHGQGFRVGDVGCHQARWAIQSCKERWGCVGEIGRLGEGHQTAATLLSTLLLDSWGGTQFQ